MSEQMGAVSTAYRVYKLSRQVWPRFIHYWFRSPVALEQYQLLIRGITTFDRAISREDLEDFPVPVPPVAEQRAIADYLDQEIYRIDALIAAKRRMHGLLAERWSGILAAHLDLAGHSMKPVRRIVTKVEQGWSPLAESRLPEDGEWCVLKTGAVNGMRFRRDEVKALPADLEPQERFLVRDGDLLMSRANTKELVGSVGLVAAVRPRTLLCDKLYRIFLDQRMVTPDWFVMAMSTARVRSELALDATGASDSMQNVGQDTLFNLKLPVPDVLEQRRAIGVLSSSFAVLSEQQRLLDASVALLVERREALIAAAVTGDVEIQGATA